MTKKPAFWLFFVLIAGAATVFSSRYFTRAFPLLSLDIRMDRSAALARARALAEDHHLGPAVAREAASFSIDETVQTFVELEGGGKSVFATLLADRLFTPYHWSVRRFQEREKNEVTFSFAPDGTTNGFLERLREDAAGAALPSEGARLIAEQAARHTWGADLDAFQPVEQAQERRPGGRIDYSFVYERTDRRLGDGRYRLRLTVSGDKLTELTYFLKIPEGFSRRYEQMRSVNDAIGVGGSLAFLVLYGGFGMAVGLFFLMRHRAVLWRQPVAWGVGVALAQTAARVNEWPLAWMQYDTALSTRSFVAQQVALAVGELAVYAVLFSLSFMAAESLTRRAFPRHPQFWRLWGRDAGRSSAVFGRTVAGYLLVPLFVAYEVVLYLVATKSLGWWTPSEALFNPDVLAAYAPWLSAVARSFQAGFWEESLFRAVPIAGAALIGDRVGGRRYWIALAFVVQAAIFGAGHAPYPTQPAYARPVELVVPSIGFGLLYLVFGLLPGIVLHFTFDAFWFAMPLFATSAAGIRLQQIMMVVMVMVPLWVVLVRRIMAADSAAADVPLNASWVPAETAALEPVAEPVAHRIGWSPSRMRLVAAAGLTGVAIWTVTAFGRHVERHHLVATSAEAVRVARTAVSSARLGSTWRFLPAVSEPDDPAHRFVWKTAGASTYRSLLGTYLGRPGFAVFVRTFEGDVEDRAETWTVDLDAQGGVRRVEHELPESRSGPSLSEPAARDLAKRALVDRFGISAAALKDISATPDRLPERTDWTVTFADSSRTLPQGELRLSARIAGAEVADASRFVFVPETWQRAERSARTTTRIVQGATALVGAVVVLGGVIAALVSWSRRRFNVGVFLALLVAFLALGAARLFNAYPSLMASLSTAQPLRLQLAVLLGSGIVALFTQSVALALVGGVAPSWCDARVLAPRQAWTIGLSLGALAAAVLGLGAWAVGGPYWPSYAGAGAVLPWLAAATAPVTSLLSRIAVLTLIVGLANRMTAGWTRHRILVGAALFVVGGVLGNATSPVNLSAWLAAGAAMGTLLLIAYLLVLRDDVSVIPIAAAVVATAGSLPEGLARPYVGALEGAVVAVAVVWLTAYAWFHALATR
jgi:hypothetical protein